MYANVWSTVLDKFLKKFFCSEMEKIPDDYIDKFQEEKLSINFSRVKICSIVLIIWNSFMCIYTGIGALNGAWARMSPYKYEFYLHIAGVVISSLYMWIYGRGKNKYSPLLNISFIFFVLSWTAAITIVDLSINQQMIVYTMGVMGVSIGFLASPKENILIYISTYVLLIVGTIFTQDSNEIVESSILNGLMLTVLGVVISKIVLSFYVLNYIKTLELEKSQLILEEAIQKRTEELAFSNQQLIQEINTRHDMELQVLNAELKYQKKLVELNEEMEYERIRDEFFTNISHELRTPLNIIFCTLQMLNTLKNDSVVIDKKRLSKYTDTMKQNCYRLTRLINNIIDITEVDSGYYKIKLRNSDIVQIVENIILSVAPIAENNKYEIIFEKKTNNIVIACDPDMITRIMLNLLSNAFKFSESKSSIIIAIFQINGYVVIRVKDNGIGISDEDQKVIFNKFIQVDKTTTRNNEGSGIGLSLVKSFVQMHNGTIDVISEPGKGSEFIIELPDSKVENDQENEDYDDRSIIDLTEKIKIEFSDIYNIEVI